MIGRGGESRQCKLESMLHFWPRVLRTGNHRAMRRQILWLLAAALVLPGLEGAQPKRARKAMVVSREANATDAGVAVLQAGGNAIDAAAAVGLALAVTHPSAGNLGGGGFLLARFADGRTTFIDFRERASPSVRNWRATVDLFSDNPAAALTIWEGLVAEEWQPVQSRTWAAAASLGERCI